MINDEIPQQVYSLIAMMLVNSFKRFYRGDLKYKTLSGLSSELYSTRLTSHRAGMPAIKSPTGYRRWQVIQEMVGGAAVEKLKECVSLRDFTNLLVHSYIQVNHEIKRVVISNIKLHNMLTKKMNQIAILEKKLIEQNTMLNGWVDAAPSDPHSSAARLWSDDENDGHNGGPPPP